MDLSCRVVSPVLMAGAKMLMTSVYSGSSMWPLMTGVDGGVDQRQYGIMLVQLRASATCPVREKPAAPAASSNAPPR